MKVDKIIPCICCDHEPNCGDSVYYGMPQLNKTLKKVDFARFIKQRSLKND